ncbi:MAG: tetratricopeptide repeat protein, partial [Thermodesulfobacteriota bacterium]
MTKKGSTEEAIRLFEESIKKNPEDDQAYNKLGNAYYDSGQYKLALEQYKIAWEKSNGKASEWIYISNIGDAYSRLLNYEEAIKHYEKALNINPKDDLINNSLGNAYSLTGNNDKAIDFYQKAISINPKPVYYTNIGDVYRIQGDHSKAKLFYSESVSLDPNYAPAQNALGVIYFSDMKDSDALSKAIEHYSKAVENDPDNFTYNANLGDAFRAVRKWDEAIKYYNIALKSRPDDFQLNNGIGVAYYFKGDLEKAIEYYSKAIEGDSNNHNYYA